MELPPIMIEENKSIGYLINFTLEYYMHQINFPFCSKHSKLIISKRKSLKNVVSNQK